MGVSLGLCAIRSCSVTTFYRLLSPPLLTISPHTPELHSSESARVFHTSAQKRLENPNADGVILARFISLVCAQVT